MINGKKFNSIFGCAYRFLFEGADVATLVDFVKGAF